MKVFHVDASPKRERSNSRGFAQHFLKELHGRGVKLDVDYLDVSVNPPPHTTEAFAIATYKPEAERTPEMWKLLEPSTAMCQRVMAADALLFAMPMYNWSMPASFKAFIDYLIRTNVTYKFGPDGSVIGQLDRQKTLFITSRGADLREGSPFYGMDALTPSLKAAFGFLGVKDMTFVDAQPMQFADQDAREAAIVRARQELADVAAQWAANASAVAA
jgi:FMN-dependent NADH-azoreductase